MALYMKNKFTDEELMAFADKETSTERSMDILGVLLQGDDEAKELAKRLDVFIDTRNALINTLIGDKK
jgi:LDH2 family malate/lactate/ureidoglycolate dehydrogenase